MIENLHRLFSGSKWGKGGGRSLYLELGIRLRNALGLSFERLNLSRSVWLFDILRKSVCDYFANGYGQIALG